MEEICNQLDSCVLCTGRGCHWLLAKGRCIWEGKGKVVNEVWECVPGSTTHYPSINNNIPVVGTVDQLVQANDDQNLVLVVTLGIMLGLVLLGGVAIGVHITLRRRLAGRTTSVSHTRLLEAMGYESDTLMARIRQQLSPRPAPPPPPPRNPSPPAHPPTPILSSSSSSSSSPNSTTVQSPSTSSSFSTPSAFSTPAQSDHPSPSTPLLHGQAGHQGTQTRTRYFDSTPEYPDDLEMVDLTPSPTFPPKGDYNLRSHHK